MATFQDPYANADYIATLLSGQVAGGYLENKSSEATQGFWKATSTNLGLNFSATAITGFSYTPNQSAGTVGRLQFSTDGSNVKAIDGSNIAVGAYDFDLLEYIEVPASASLEDMWTSGVTFSVWVKPDTGLNQGQIWNKGGLFLTRVDNESSSKYKFTWIAPFMVTAWFKSTTGRPIYANKWNHVVAKWSGAIGDDPVIYINGVLAPVTTTGTPAGAHRSDTTRPLYIPKPDSGQTYAGSMSDLIFWRSELTDTQMKEIYLYTKIPAGFVARYRLADTTTAVGGVIIDDTTNNNGALKCDNPAGSSSSSSSSSSSGSSSSSSSSSS